LNERVYYIANISSFIFIIGVFIYLASSSSSSSLKLTRGNSDIKETPVYQVAQHLNQERKEGRILVYGDSGLWLNVFSDLPQVNGFSELGNNHPYWEKGIEEVRKSKDPETVLAWLSAMNVKYLVVPKSEAQKFEGLLEKDIEVGDLVVLSVPLKNSSLVKIVNTSKVDGFSFDGSESGAKEYQKLIEENPSPKIIDWPKKDLKIQISNLKSDQGLIIQTSYDKGFSASLDGKRLKVEKDPFGFIYLKPEKSGTVTINLSHKLPGSVWFGYSITLLTLLYLGLLQVKPIRKFLMWQEVKIPPGVLIRPEALAKEEVTPELIEKTKKYYREEENLDWVEMTDQFKGIVSYFHQNREALVKKLVEQFGEGKKYLDAGCGTGLLLRHLPEGSVGLDINPRAISKAKEYAPKAALVVADIEEIPFPGDTFETVLCVDVLDRLPHPARAISEIKRVLKRDGILIGTVPALNPLWRLQFLTATAPPTEPYRKEYTKREIEKLLAPFKIIHLSPALSNMTWAFVARKRD
jgi:SAM-dependent methyltransferase